MSAKSGVMLGMIVGSTLGGSIPMLWGAGMLSYMSLILSAIGGMLGIWVGLKVFNE